MVGQEDKVGKSPKAGSSHEVDDVKYVLGLSTVLVAAIQEAKDKISQIEYIFCSQLFHNFKSKSRSLQAIYAEALESAESTWKQKEDNLLIEIEKLRIDKDQLVQENQSFKVRIEEFECDLGQKIKEVDEGMKLQGKLIQLLQSSESNYASTVKQLREEKEMSSALLLEQRSLNKSIEGLKEELRQKTDEIAKSKQLEMNLLKKMEIQDSDIFGKEQLLLDCEKEKGLLKVKLKQMEEQIGRLEKDLCKNTKQGQEAEKLSNQLIHQINSERTENVNSKMQLKQHEQERAELLSKVKNLEGRVNDLQSLHRRKSFDGNQEERFHQQLQSEKKKMADLLNKYKSLKSQYNYLLKKNCPWSSPGVQDRPEQNLVTTPGSGNKSTGTSNYGAKVKDEVDVHDPMENEIDDSLSRNAVNYGAKGKAEVDADAPVGNEKDASLPKTASPTSGEFVTPKSLNSKRSSPVSGTKRPSSSWRDTRSHQSRCGPDPHDDFLDTPLENIRVNLNNVQKAKVGNLPNHEPEGADHEAPDDAETEDMNVDPQPEKLPARATSDGSRKSFKFVSAVRKKAERETLKGVECKQCKKFYDAVLPDNNGNTDRSDTSGTKTNFRCEHLDGASRHRYKYVPPLTPEGFWNIGFESEM